MSVIAVFVGYTLWFRRFPGGRERWRQRMPERIVLIPEGVRLTTPLYDTFAAWSLVGGIDYDDERIYLFYGKPTREVSAVPKSAFADEAEAERFLAAAREYVERASAARSSRAAEAPGESSSVGKHEETDNPYEPPRA